MRISDWSSDVLLQRCFDATGAIAAAVQALAGQIEAQRTLFAVQMQMQADVGLLGIDVRPLQACRAKAIDDRVLEFQSREMRVGDTRRATGDLDRKSTRLNSSH